MADSGRLSEEQICECLKSLNVNVRLNEVKVPSREFIVRVFECFLRDLEIDVTGSELRTWEATDHLEDREIYEESMSLALLAKAVNHITQPCGINITIREIVEPKPKRTKKILNYIILFWNYYLQKLARFHTIEATYEEDKRKVEELLSENQSLDDKLSDMGNVLGNMQPNKEELSDVVSKLGQKTTKLKAESDAIASEYQGLKSKEANLRSEISNYDVLVVKAKQTIEELEQLILSSPERINNEIQKLEDKIKAEDLKMKEFESKLKEAKKKLQLLEEYEVEEEKDLKSLNDLSETVNDVRETVKGIVSSYQKIGEEKDKIKRIQMDVDRKEESIQQQEQKFATIVLSGKKQIETLKEVLDMNLKEESEEKKNIKCYKVAAKDLQDKIDSESDNVLSVIAKCKEANCRSVERKAQYMSKMKSINIDFKSDCDEIRNKVKTLFP